MAIFGLIARTEPTQDLSAFPTLGRLIIHSWEFWCPQRAHALILCHLAEAWFFSPFTAPQLTGGNLDGFLWAVRPDGPGIRLNRPWRVSPGFVLLLYPLLIGVQPFHAVVWHPDPIRYSPNNCGGAWMAMTSPRAHTCPLADNQASITTFRPFISFTLARTSSGTPRGVGLR
jgi:hypothetical protein